MTVILDEETLEWHSVTDSLPDADTTVLVFAPAADDPIWLGYFDGTSWFADTGMEYSSYDEQGSEVKAWASLPLGPQRLWR